MLTDPFVAAAAAHNRSTVFVMKRQCARRPSNIRFLGLHSLTTANNSSVSSAVFAQLMPHSHYTSHCVAPFPQISPFPWGSGPHLIHSSLDLLDPPSQTVDRSSQPFLHNTRSLRTEKLTDRQNDWHQQAANDICKKRPDKK